MTFPYLRKKTLLVSSLLIFTLSKGYTMPKTAPYGSWKSPITSTTLVQNAVKLSQMNVDGNALYWIEVHPKEKGRYVIVKWENGEKKELLPAPFNARTRVHEYGGGSFVISNGEIFFSNFADQLIYRFTEALTPMPITKDTNKRYADGDIDRKRKVIFSVEEDQTDPNEVLNNLARIDMSGVEEPVVIQKGYDFYANPRMNPSGSQIAWTCWNHPNMPWDDVELWLGELDQRGNITSSKKIAGGKEESICQVSWGPDGTLFYISDRTGYWNFYSHHSSAGEEALYPVEMEFGEPMWIFGSPRYTFIPDKDGYKIATIYTKHGSDFLGILDPKGKSLENIDLPFSDFRNIHYLSGQLFFQAGSPTTPLEILSYDLSKKKLSSIQKSQELNIENGYISKPQTIEFPTENNKTAFAFYYPPANKDFQGPGNELPPLIVKSHGGPSSHSSSVLNPETQFWTSRGFAFVDVNYGGSTGHGREYRKRLDRNWGTVDVDDCCNAAKFLYENHLVDKNRLAIRGGSAGGYTTLASLAFTDMFKAGASYFGVSDLEAMATFTHKFEARYLDSLVGIYPQEKERYQKYSPICHLDKFSCPVIFLQGDEDKIVPPEQSEMMYEKLLKKGIPTAYLLFEKEQHGFRMSENIQKAVESELYFYAKIFHFSLADEIDPIEIKNLKVN